MTTVVRDKFYVYDFEGLVEHDFKNNTSKVLNKAEVVYLLNTQYITLKIVKQFLIDNNLYSECLEVLDEFSDNISKELLSISCLLKKGVLSDD